MKDQVAFCQGVRGIMLPGLSWVSIPDFSPRLEFHSSLEKRCFKIMSLMLDFFLTFVEIVWFSKTSK